MKVLESRQIINLDQTKDFIESIIVYIKPGVTIGLIGTLGAGKTTFTRLLAERLGSVDPVSSPTYVLQHEYRIPGGMLEHWDLYRLNCAALDLSEPLRHGSIRIIEWADKFDEVLKTLDYSLKIDIDSPDSRRFSFVKS